MAAKTCLFKFLAGVLVGLGPLSHPGLAQQRPACGTAQYQEQLHLRHPAFKARAEHLSREATRWAQTEGVRKTEDEVITIPVVVHVVYSSPEGNISDSQIQSQIDVLNEDFRRMNADAAQTPAEFLSIAADTRIQFALAVRDPDDNPTLGITRTPTTVTAFRVDDAIMAGSRGGKDPWDPTSYLNIWVGSVQDDFLGYAQFPGGPVKTDGVVIGYKHFGREGTAEAPFNRGRSTVHEVGHWLNLKHLWGNGLCGDDEVADTPSQQAATYGCPAFPKRSCGPTSDMFMNYMDYTDDACMNLFTLGQRDRIHAALRVARPGILTSSGNAPVVVPTLDASVFAIRAPGPFFCEPDFAPKVVLKNTGRTPLTEATIHFGVEGRPSQTYRWRGNLHSFESEEVLLPSLQVEPGSHSFTASVAAPNGGQDQNSANNQQSVSFVTIRQEPGLPMPLAEGFEGAAFPPLGWQLQNPDGRTTWQPTTLAALAGSGSVFLPNFSYTFVGETDELVLPALDLSTAPNPKLTFGLAYTLYSDRGFSDTLEILLSTDCGVSYSSIYKKYGPALVTTSVGYQEDPFYPAGAAQWRTETIDLAAYGQNRNVIIKFRNTTDYENNLFLDEITVKGIQQVNLYPNPTQGTFALEIPAHLGDDVEVLVMDLAGRKIRGGGKADFVGSILTLNLAGNPAGVYVVRVRQAGHITLRKVVLTR